MGRQNLLIEQDSRTGSTRGLRSQSGEPIYLTKFKGLRAESVEFGDSITQYGFSGTYNAGFSSCGGMQWAGALAAGRNGPLILPKWNLGVGGNTLDQMIARLDTVKAVDADICNYMGGTNSISDTYADFVDKQETIIGTLSDRFPLVNVRGMPPQNRTGSAYRQVIPFYNQAIERICSRYGNVIYHDTFRALVDPASRDGAPYGYGSADYVLKDEIGTFGIDLHPSDYGGLRDGFEIAARLAGRLETVSGESYGPNLITLAGAAGTLSNGTGTVAGDNPHTGWAVTVVSGNANVNVIRLTNGLRLSITSTTASAVTITGGNYLPQLANAQTVRHGAKIRIANVSGISNFRNELVSGGQPKSRTIDYAASVPAYGRASWERSRGLSMAGIAGDLIPRVVVNTSGNSSMQFDWIDPELFSVA
jgi:hypothetical protein